MKPRTTLILLATAAALALFVTLYEKERPGTSAQREAAGKLLPGLDPAAVQRLELVRPTGKLIVAKQADNWEIEAPLKDRADRYAIDGLLREIADTAVERRIQQSELQGGDDASGLGGQALSVTLQTTAGQQYLEIGGIDVSGGKRYARVNRGEELVLIGRALATSLDRPVEPLRDHSLFTLATSDVASFALERAGGGPLRFEQRGTDRWWLTIPREDAANHEAVVGLLSRLLNLRVERFPDTPPTTLPGQERPWLSATFYGSDQKPLGSLRIGELIAGTTHRHAVTTLRTTPFELNPGDLGTDLARSDEGWRSMLAIDTSAWDLRSIEVERDGRKTTLSRVESAGEKVWQAAADSPLSLDPAKIADVAAKLARVDALRIADEIGSSAAGLDRPRVRVTLHHEDATKNPPETLSIGAEAGPRQCYAAVAGRAAILVVDASWLETLDPARWVKSQVPPAPASPSPPLPAPGSSATPPPS